MRSKTVLILAIMLSSFGLRLSVAQQPAQCIAVITEINGNAFLKKSTKSEFTKASWGTQLFEGDQIKTSDRSEAKLLFSNSSFISLGANSMITISGKESPATDTSGNVKKVSSAAMVNLSAFILKRDDKKDVGALAGMRSVNTEQIIEPTSPYNTLIKTNYPSFSWISKKSFDKYIVNLYNSKGLVWSNKVSGTMMKYPDNEKGLEFGESYFWNVEGEDLLDNKKSSSFKFSILPTDKSKEVLVQEALIRNTFDNDASSSSLHSFLGAYYINHGLLQDAIDELQVVARINPDAPLPHEIMGSLYSDVGNKDRAIEELQKALALSKSKE